MGSTRVHTTDGMGPNTLASVLEMPLGHGGLVDVGALDGLESGRASRPAADAKSKRRWLALDLLRFTAVFLMVQGHTFSTLLDPIYQGQRWFRHHSFVHGYTAPMFLFASGLAFGYTTFAQWEKQTRPGDALTKRFRRYGWLLLIGYFLHMPALALGDLVRLGDGGALRAWLQVDVLQHIAVSLGILQVTALVVKRERVFVGLVALYFVIAVFGAPLVWRWPAETQLPLALSGFVNSRSGSLFPLFPWAGFTHAGVLVAFAAKRVRKPSIELAWPFVALTAFLAIVPIAVNRLGVQLYGPHDFWKTDPYYFFFRLANVLGVLSAWCLVEKLADRRGWLEDGKLVAELVSMVRVVGAESLLIYVVHLVVLHGSIATVGLVSHTGASLTLGEACTIAFLLFVSMVLLARIFTDFKASSLRFRLFQLVACGLVVGFVVTR